MALLSEGRPLPASRKLMSRSCTRSCISWSPASGSVMAWRLPHIPHSSER